MIRILKTDVAKFNSIRPKYLDLSRANLSGADLSEADLSGVNLSGANLSWADLSGAKLSPKLTLGGSPRIRSYSSVVYPCIFFDDIIKIGCEVHTLEEWESFGEGDIREMDGDKAVEFWVNQRGIIRIISRGNV